MTRSHSNVAGFRTVVYTSVFGGFESIWPPLRPSLAHRHLAVTDSSVQIPGWEVVRPTDTMSLSHRLANRRQKMLFHEGLTEVDFSVYLDANVRPIRALDSLVRHFAESGADVGFYPHYARSSVRQELEACIRRAKIDDPDTALAELESYEEAGFPDKSGMWEGSVIIKNHRSKNLSAAMHEWWDLYSEFQTRDQFSLPFVVWKHGLTVANLDDEPFGREHYFVRLQHSSAGRTNSLARYLQARSAENPIWNFAHNAIRVAKGVRQKLTP